MLPDRAVPVVFALTVNSTTPLPVPGVPEVTTIQGTLLTAVQVQPADVVTETMLDAPLEGMFRDGGENVNVQPDSWLTVTVRPAIVTVPARGGPGFAAIDRVTWPLPVPVAPAVTVIHGTLAVAVHAHPAIAVTSTRAVPPAAPEGIASGATA